MSKLHISKLHVPSQTGTTLLHHFEELRRSCNSPLRSSGAHRIKAELNRDWDFSISYNDLVKQYRSLREPLHVNFRRLVPLRSGADRFTHLVHSYPAKLIVNIPLFFLNCSSLGKPGDTVWDPFCGTGTSLLEAVLAGKRASGADANPLARLITQVKLTKVCSSSIERALLHISSTFRELDPALFQPVVNVEHWFSARTITELGQLKTAIDGIHNQDLQNFFLVCLSAIVRKCSFVDPRLSVPVRRKDDCLRDEVAVFPTFAEAVRKNSERISRLKIVPDEILRGIDLQTDARTQQKGELCDLIISSPPYVGAQKYIRSSSLSIGWLGLAPEAKLRNLEKQNIGREHFSYNEFNSELGARSRHLRGTIAEIAHVSPIRAHIAMTYFDEMSVVIKNMYSRLKSGGSLVMITGDNTIAGKAFPTSYFLQEMIIASGMYVELEALDNIPSRGLMTKRNKAAAIIAREHVTVFRKM